VSQPATINRTESLSLKTDEQLMQLVVQGQAAAYQQLVERHLRKVVALSRRAGLSPSDAEDVAQDVFLTLWQKPFSYEASRSRFSTWLYRVTFNRSIDRLRRQTARRTNSLEQMIDAAGDSFIDRAPLAIDQLEHRERQQMVQQAIAHLTPPQKSALHLAYSEQLSGREGAHIMGTSLKAYEALLGRARQKLKALLNVTSAEISAQPQEVAYARSR
jgi:RNA polymerase sigma-70 factor (ECF subfamily)